MCYKHQHNGIWSVGLCAPISVLASLKLISTGPWLEKETKSIARTKSRNPFKRFFAVWLVTTRLSKVSHDPCMQKLGRWEAHSNQILSAVVLWRTKIFPLLIQSTAMCATCLSPGSTLFQQDPDFSFHVCWRWRNPESILNIKTLPVVVSVLPPTLNAIQKFRIALSC